MKGSWVTTFAVGGVILLLTLFLGLQYNWLAQASDAERERMQRRVEADTKSFADDFNREMQAAYFNFQVDVESFKNRNWTEFNERYDYWKSKTKYPDLIREIVYVGKDQPQRLRFDPAARSFVDGGVDERLEQFLPKIENSPTFQFFYDEPLVLVMPIHESEPKLERIILRRTSAGEAPSVQMPERSGVLIIHLDRSVLTGRMLPDLTEAHFPEGDFRVAVTGNDKSPVFEPSGEIDDGDAAAGLLSLAPDNMIFLANRGMWPELHGEKRRGVVISERVESKTFTHSETTADGTKTGTVTVKINPKTDAIKSRTSVVATSSTGDAPWVLKTQHTAGSIEAFARGQFLRSFLIGLSLYLLLVGAIVAIVLSAMRSKRLARRKIDFVSSVSHEFRTPLAVIYSASENLADGVTKDVEQVSRYGELIKSEGRKLSAMVEQILQFAGASSGRKKYNFSMVNAAEVVDGAIKDCRPVLEEKGFEIETAVDEKLPLVRADADALFTAVRNLISNAVKYSNGSKWLRVAAANGGNLVKLSVQDRGIGIGSDDLKHIFEPFYRSKSVVDAQIHGNGLGLALVKEIAEAHGGKVTANSEVGKGSEFTIELPSRN